MSFSRIRAGSFITDSASSIKHQFSFSSSPASLYIHIPFCKKKCLYCDFASVPPGETDLDDYPKILIREMSLHEQYKADTLYIGGGTPSLLSPLQIEHIIDAAKTRFGLGPETEISMEANPESVTPEKLTGFRKAGINRISLGVQSLSDLALKFIGRLADKKTVLAGITALEKSGVDNFNFDIMAGLPFQTTVSLLAEIRELLQYHPSHISLYLLTLHKHVPLDKKMKQKKIKTGPEEEMLREAAAYLEQQGFKRYEISNFALPGKECRHNLTYWNYLPYAGFGPSATGFDGQQRYTNDFNLTVYETKVSQGRLPVKETEILDEPTRKKEFIMMNLRKSTGFELEEFRKRFGTDFMDENGRIVNRLMDDGYMLLSEGRLRIHPERMIVSNAVIAEFF